MGRTAHFANGAFKGVPLLAQAAQAWASIQGQTRPESYSSVVANPVLGRRIAEQYEAAPDYQHAAVPHFQAMREETSHQFEFLTGARRHGGLGVDVSVHPDDPYAASKTEDDPQAVQAMMQDLREGHLKVLDSRSTGGHPFFSDDQNNQFRAVHDAFGHGGTGRGFDRHGEEAAYRSHATMYSPKARPALATETRGQTSALNFGSTPGTFQPQKIVTLPDAGKIVPIGRRSQARAAILQARQFHAQAFGSPL